MRRSVAELVGAFTLVFAGVGSIVVGADLLGIALAHGLAIAVMVSAVGHISGGHFNPAVTLGFLVTRRIVPRLAVAYWAAQLAGATLAALTLRAVFSPDRVLDRGVPALAEGLGAGSGLLLEIVLTFFLVWVVFRHRRRSARHVRLHRGACDRAHDHDRHPRRRAHDGSGDEPGPGVRPGARPGDLVGRVDVLGRPGPRRRARGAPLRPPLPPSAGAGAGRRTRDRSRGPRARQGGRPGLTAAPAGIAFPWRRSVTKRCAHCGEEVERRFPFCPWCAEPQRLKVTEFFFAHARDHGKALRVSRYLGDTPDARHVRFSVWDEAGVAEAAVSLGDPEARRLARFLGDRPAAPQARDRLRRLLTP